MTVTRVILVSDSHLSTRTPEAQANWDAALRYIEAAAPDLVIHLGDLSLDGAHSAADIDYARRQLDRLPAAWHAVPGNHDVGDNPWPGAPRRHHHRRRETAAVAGCGRRRLLGADGQRLDPAGLQRPADRLRPGRRGRAVGLAGGAGGRSRSGLPGRADHAQAAGRGRRRAGRRLGAKRCGIAALEFAGAAAPRPEFAEPDGIRQLTITRDIPNPYHA